MMKTIIVKSAVSGQLFSYIAPDNDRQFEIRIHDDDGWVGQRIDMDKPPIESLSDLKAALAEYGLVAVPAEPTEEMIDEADSCFDSSVRQMYKAMIKAAQRPTE